MQFLLGLALALQVILLFQTKVNPLRLAALIGLLGTSALLIVSQVAHIELGLISSSQSLTLSQITVSLSFLVLLGFMIYRQLVCGCHAYAPGLLTLLSLAVLTGVVIEDGVVNDFYYWSANCLVLFSILHAVGLFIVHARIMNFFEAHVKARNKIAYAEASVELNNLTKSFRHDLRQPLNTIGIVSNVGKMTTKDNDIAKKFDHIKLAQASLARMLEDFTAEIDPFNKMRGHVENSGKQTYPVAKLLADLVDEYTPLATSKGITLKLISSELEFKGSVQNLAQIIRNALDNAIKYTNDGYVLVTVRRPWLSRSTNTLFIDIIDSGTGIDNDEVSKSAKGWGIGRRIVEKLANELNASISLSNRRDGQRGSKWSLSVPLSQASPKSTPATGTDQLNGKLSLIYLSSEHAAMCESFLDDSLLKESTRLTISKEKQLIQWASSGKLAPVSLSVATTQEHLLTLQTLAQGLSVKLGDMFVIIVFMNSGTPIEDVSLYPNLAILKGNDYSRVSPNSHQFLKLFGIEKTQEEDPVSLRPTISRA